jgi:EAL domain-containing protein (putative c-di-GMP-specific phosphodiesterase class I)
VSSSSLLDTILEPDGLSVRFQPILELREDDAGLFALECLVGGPSATNLEPPDILLEYARRKRAESFVDRASLAAALRGAVAIPSDADLYVKVHATTLCHDPEFLNFLGDTATARGIRLARLIVGVVENAARSEVVGFQETLDALRHIGVRIALDDVGLGGSDCRMIVECRADYFKVDRHFVRGCDADPHRRAVLDSVSHLARRLGARVVAEGVEAAADLEAVARLGVDLVQGDYLCPALPAQELTRTSLLGESDAPAGGWGISVGRARELRP